jgi:hypothetical protein
VTIPAWLNLTTTSLFLSIVRRALSCSALLGSCLLFPRYIHHRSRKTPEHVSVHPYHVQCINQSTKASQRANQAKPSQTEPNHTKQTSKKSPDEARVSDSNSLRARSPNASVGGRKKRRERRKRKRIKKSIKTPCSALNFILPNSGREEGGRKCSSACLYDERRRAASKPMTDSSERAMATKWAWYTSANAAF